MSQKDLLLVIAVTAACLLVGYLVLKKAPQDTVRPVEEQPVQPWKPPVSPPSEPSPPPEHPRVVEPEFVEVPVVSSRYREESLYADIMNRQSSPFTSSDRDTNAHETTHGINSDLRNKYTRQLGKRVNGFYVTGGKGVIIEEPKLRIRDVVPYLPSGLRSYRYQTYLIQQQSGWDDVPLYLVDEWVAYVNGASVSVEDVERGRHNGQWTDAVSGCLDFSIYCVALCMAIEEKDPGYWQSNTQFRNFMTWHLKKAHTTFMKGRNMEQFRWDKQEKLLQSLRNSEDGKRMRDFLNKYFDGLWLEEGQRVPFYVDRPGKCNILENLLRQGIIRDYHSPRMYFCEPQRHNQ